MNQLIQKYLFSFILSTLLLISASLQCKEQNLPPFLENYEFLEELGRGTYSTVFLGQNSGGELVAIKEYAIKDSEMIAQFAQYGVCAEEMITHLALKEQEIGLRTNHPNIVKVKEVLFADSAAYVVMEYIHGQTIDHFEQAPFKIRLFYIQQFLNALKHLLEHGVIIDDLWSANLMISTGDHLTLIDLGGMKLSGKMPTKSLSTMWR